MTFLRIIRQEYTFRQYLVSILCLYLLALLAGFLLQGEGALFDVRSLLVSVALVILLLWMVCRPAERIFGFWAMTAVTFLIFIFPRILMYVLVPAMVTFPFGQNIDRTTISMGLTYVLLGTAALAAGQILYERLMPARSVSGTMASNSVEFGKLPLLMIIFLLFLIIQIYISSGLGISPYVLNPRMATFWENVLVQLVIVTIDPDMLLLICFIVLLGRSDLSEKSRWLFAVSIATCYMFTSAYLGARGGSMRLLIILIAVLLARYGNFRVSIYRIVSVVSLLLLIGWVSFPIATMQRMKLVSTYNIAAKEVVQKNLSPAKEPTEKIFSSEMVKKITASATDKLNEALVSMSSILNRMGALDYAILVVTQPADPGVKRKIMTIEYTLKSLINSAPGTPFPDAELNTSRLVTALFRPGTSEAYVKAFGYHSEYYTAWGLLFLLFGWWGGLLALGVVGVILAALQDILRIGQWSIYFKALFIWIMPMAVILSMGLDHSIFLVFVENLRLSMALIILVAITAAVIRTKPYFVPVLKGSKSSDIT